MTQLATIIERLTEVVEQETVQLRQRTSIDLKSFNDRRARVSWSSPVRCGKSMKPRASTRPC